jgi:hypothetical protein
LQRQHPGRFADGQLRTLQRRLKHWRATAGPEQEVFFAQQHVAGRLGQSDFTRMGELNITIGGQSFPHLLYHFVLTYSNWEAVSLCYSESCESLSDGLRNALWELGGAPLDHRTDRMSLAVNNASDEREFTTRYEALLRHYKKTGQKIQAGRRCETAALPAETRGGSVAAAAGRSRLRSGPGQVLKRAGRKHAYPSSRRVPWEHCPSPLHRHPQFSMQFHKPSRQKGKFLLCLDIIFNRR